MITIILLNHDMTITTNVFFSHMLSVPHRRSSSTILNNRNKSLPRSPLNISLTIRKPIFLKCGRQNYRRQNNLQPRISLTLNNSSIICRIYILAYSHSSWNDFRKINTGQKSGRGFLFFSVFLFGRNCRRFWRRYNAIATRAHVAFGQ